MTKRVTSGAIENIQNLSGRRSSAFERITTKMIRLRSRWNWISQCQRVHRESDLIVPFLVPSRDPAS